MIIGASWCKWCDLLATELHSKRLSSVLQQRYNLVFVDIGHFDKNLQIAAELGATVKQDGIPYLVVLGPNGEMKVRQASTIFEVDNGYSSESIELFVRRWSSAESARELNRN